MIIRHLRIALFIIAFSGNGFATSPLFDTEKVTQLLETAHLNWLSTHPDQTSVSSNFEFILRRQRGYEAPAESFTPSIEGYSYSKSTKHFKAKLILTADEKENRTYPVEGFAYPLIHLPALQAPLMAGSRIAAEDIELITLREDRLQPYMETKADQLVGMEVVNSLQAHKPISKRHIKSPRLIQKGEFVNISINNNGIQLSAQGKALQAGGKGELISVMNNSSKKIVQGKVIGPRQVRIMMAGSI